MWVFILSLIPPSTLNQAAPRFKPSSKPLSAPNEDLKERFQQHKQRLECEKCHSKGTFRFEMSGKDFCDVYNLSGFAFFFFFTCLEFLLTCPQKANLDSLAMQALLPMTEESPRDAIST